MPAQVVGAITVYTAQKIITMNPSLPTATAVAVRDGRILEVGTLETLRPWLEMYPHTIDDTFADKIVLPGFIDPHMHPLLGAMLLNTVWITPEPWDLPWGHVAPTHGRAAYLARLQELFAADQSDSPLFSTWGYHAFWHGEVTRQDLDAISTTRPIYISHRSFHEGIFNTAALNLLQLTAAQFQDNPQADFAKGHFVEEAFIRLVLPKASAYILPPAAFDATMRKTLQMLQAGGITTVSDMSTGSTDWKLETAILASAFEHDACPVRVRCTPDVFALSVALGSPEQAIAFIAGLPAQNTHHVSAGRAVKLFADGAFFSQRMQMNWPAYMDGHKGEWLTAPEQFAALARLCWNAGYEIHVHTNGDLGLDLVLDTLEQLWNEKPRINHRFTIEHFGCSTPEQCRRIADLGALVSANVFYLYDMGAQYAATGLGYERAAQMARVGTLARLGVTTTYHSDFPMAPQQPLVWVWGAVNRFNLDGAVMAPEECVTIDQALRAITVDAAYVLHMEDEIGSIRAGKWADFTVLEQDPYAVPAAEVKDIKVWGTVFEGQVFPVVRQNKEEQL